MPTAVMPQAEQDEMFDQLENNAVFSDDAVPMPDGVEAGKVNTVYPGKLPGSLMTIYDTKSGYSTQVLPYMLKSVMKMKYADGTPRYSRRQTMAPVVGTYWCFLHPNFPDAANVRASGIAVQCSKKAPLLSVMHAERHAETRHGDNWKIYQRFLSEARDAEQREFQRLQLEALRATAGRQVSDDRVYCGVDGCARFFDSETSAAMHRAKHKGE